jgi:predicted Zn-dependent peptidase
MVGDVDVAETLAFLQRQPEFQGGEQSERLVPVYPDEEDRVASPSQRIPKPINIAYASVSGKLPKAMLKTPLEAALLEIKLGFLLESLIGKQSANYHDLIERALANDTLDFLGSVEPTFGFFRITTETRKIDGTVEALKEILAGAASTPISQAQFLASRNRMIGSFYRSFNRIDGVASVFSDYLAKDVDIEALMEAALDITIEDIVALSKDIANASLSVLVHHPDGVMTSGANRVKMI